MGKVVPLQNVDRTAQPQTGMMQLGSLGFRAVLHASRFQARGKVVGGLGLIGTAAVFTPTSACDDDKTETGKRWPQEGEWRQYGARSESLGPFLKGLGVPGFAVVMVDLLSTDLSIQVAGSTLKVTDTTAFGANKTEVELGAPEVEKSTKTGRKKFMMSGFEDGGGLVHQADMGGGRGGVSQGVNAAAAPARG